MPQPAATTVVSPTALKSPELRELSHDHDSKSKLNDSIEKLTSSNIKNVSLKKQYGAPIVYKIGEINNYRKLMQRNAILNSLEQTSMNQTMMKTVKANVSPR
jgi:hypothetical protein